MRVLPITQAHAEYADKVKAQLEDAGVRVEVDTRNEKIGYKIREAQVQKIPYMLIVGEREMEAGEVAVRHRKIGDLGSMPVAAFVERIVEEIRTKRLDPEEN